MRHIDACSFRKVGLAYPPACLPSFAAGCVRAAQSCAADALSTPALPTPALAAGHVRAVPGAAHACVVHAPTLSTPALLTPALAAGRVRAVPSAAQLRRQDAVTQHEQHRRRGGRGCCKDAVG
eukprot:273828-Chlamydomonas_euryale.AAC.2